MIELLETRYGQMFVPDTDTAQYLWLKRAGASPEDEHITAIQELLGERERGTFIDVGASFGTWTLALAPFADHVVAIEPQGAIYDLLCRSVFLNDLSRKVMTSRSAAGREPGETQVAMLDLDKPSNFGGLSLTHPFVDQPNAPTERVLVIPLDIGWEERDVSLIKIDAEGWDYDVLLGATKTIERCRPLLFVERVHPRTNEDELRALIEDMGYVTQVRGPNFLCLPLATGSVV